MPIDLSQVRWDQPAVDPSKVQWDQPDPKKKLAEDTGAGEAFTVGAGRIGDRIFEGLKQSGMGIGAIMSELLPGRLKSAAQEELTKRLIAQQKAQASNTAEYKNLEEAHPVATALGEAAPIVAAPMLRIAAGPGMGAAAVNAAASSALPAALEYGTAEERAKAAAFTGAAGAAGSGLASGAAKMFRGVSNVLTPEAQRLAALAEGKFNIPLDAAAKTGNKALQTVDAALEHMPATSGVEATRKGATADAFTRAVMKTMGEAAEEASPATFAAAKQRIGGDFDRIFGKVHIKVDDPGIQTKLAGVVQNAVDTLPQEQAAIVVKRVGQIIDKVDDNGAVAGKAYQAWRSQMQKQAEGSSDRWLATSLRDTYRVIDEAAYSAAADAGEDVALKTARGQWKNMRTIEPLIAKSEDGRISPKLLRGEVMRANPNFAEGGGGDIAELARIGRSFVADQVPNSGTAQRAMAQTLLTGGIGGATFAATGDPEAAMKASAGTLLGTMAVPKLAQAAIRSKAGQGFLMGEKAMSPLEQALLERAARLGILGAANEGGR